MSDFDMAWLWLKTFLIDLFWCSLIFAALYGVSTIIKPGIAIFVVSVVLGFAAYSATKRYLI